MKYCIEKKADKVIRVSSAKKFNLAVNEYVYEGFYIYTYVDNTTSIIIDYENNNVFYFISNES